MQLVAFTFALSLAGLTVNACTKEKSDLAERIPPPARSAQCQVLAYEGDIKSAQWCPYQGAWWYCQDREYGNMECARRDLPPAKFLPAEVAR